eukprot:scaffold166174_cov18-Prasinocladus_malaysianus.AAC.1
MGDDSKPQSSRRLRANYILFPDDHKADFAEFIVRWGRTARYRYRLRKRAASGQWALRTKNRGDEFHATDDE